MKNIYVKCFEDFNTDKIRNDVWYHGSQKHFLNFEIGFSKKIDWFGVGIYLTKNKKRASYHAKEGGMIYEVKLKNAKIVNGYDKICEQLKNKLISDNYLFYDMDNITFHSLHLSLKKYIHEDKDICIYLSLFLDGVLYTKDDMGEDIPGYNLVIINPTVIEILDCIKI